MNKIFTILFGLFLLLSFHRTVFPEKIKTYSPDLIEIPSLKNIPGVIDVPEKINAIPRITPGSIGVDPSEWGERTARFFGGMKWLGEKQGLDYVDPLTADETEGVEHYEVVHHGKMLTEIMYRNYKGELDIDEHNEAAIVRYRYDSRGNLVEESSYDSRSRLKTDWYGYAVYRWKYDEKGRRTEVAYYDDRGRITGQKFADVAVTHFIYGEKGNRIRWINYDKEGRLALDVLGASVRVSSFDDAGNTVLEVIYGTDRKPATGKYGYCAVMTEYDENGKRISGAYYDSSLKPYANNGVFVERKISIMDGAGNEIAFYGTDGALAQNKDGIAIVQNLLNSDGTPVKQRLFNKEKQLISEQEYNIETGRWRSVDDSME